jgi:hypothetical protein
MSSIASWPAIRRLAASSGVRFSKSEQAGGAYAAGNAFSLFIRRVSWR